MAEASATPMAGDRSRRLLGLVLAALPVAAFAALAWSRRWTADDGFINFRVVEQVLAGNGPVFNAGERVEIATSPAWVAVLAVASRVAFFARLEWVSVGVGIGLAVAALAVGGLGAASLHRPRRGGEVLLPAGLAAFVAVPPVWDFATSGLEVSLGLLWLAGCFLALARVATRAPGAGGRAPWPAAVLIGLGPLVRPDFAIFSAVFLVTLVVLARARPRAVVALGAAGLAVPVAFQLFRMAYYGALVPNTAFAKEAGLARWGQGWRYFTDFYGVYALWLPLAVLAAAVVVRRLPGRAAMVAVAFPLAAAAHSLYVVRVGGDFMHGRLLIPGLFAIVLPAAVLPVSRATALATLAALAWAVVAGTSLRPDYVDGIWGRHHIADERAAYVEAAKRDHPVTLDDYAHFWPRYARVVHDLADDGRRLLFLEEESFELGVDGVNRIPLAPGGPRAVVVFRYIGMLSYALEPDVWLVDRLGLGDPLASRVALTERGRPGHEKMLDIAWPVARFAEPGARFPQDPVFEARVAAARRALRCGPIDRILDAVTEPLSVGRMAANVRLALTTYGARFTGIPAVDAAAHCDRAVSGAAAPGR